ncbi:hypothetical protein SFRURICE_003497 [Spodoptera frugiperda]|nr:hypothetical protein SFRURICE_003497 [Spodoptera frugiperda]
MVEFMENNGDLSKPSAGPRGRSYIQAKWKELTLKLNSEGSGEPRTEEKLEYSWDQQRAKCIPTIHRAPRSLPFASASTNTSNPPFEEETWKPPPAKKSKTSLIKMCVENDRNAREYAREREKRYDMIEQERLDLRREELRIREMEIQERVRQRDAELSLQAQWQEIMKEALNDLKKKLEKNKKIRESHIDYRRANQRMTSQISCIAHMKFTCEITQIENPNEQQLGRKPDRHEHHPWSEDPPFLSHSNVHG